MSFNSPSGSARSEDGMKITGLHRPATAGPAFSSTTTSLGAGATESDRAAAAQTRASRASPGAARRTSRAVRTADRTIIARHEASPASQTTNSTAAAPVDAGAGFPVAASAPATGADSPVRDAGSAGPCNPAPSDGPAGASRRCAATAAGPAWPAGELGSAGSSGSRMGLPQTSAIKSLAYASRHSQQRRAGGSLGNARHSAQTSTI